jgi:hypothetical protein
MDFIAIDLDYYDVWERFKQPQTVSSQSFEPPNLSSSPFVKLAQASGCNDDGCWNTGDKEPRTNAGALAPRSRRGPSGIGDGANDAQERNPDDTGNEPTQEEKEKIECSAEQIREGERDSLARLLQELILRQPNSNRFEFAFVIIQAENGNLRHTQIMTGTEANPNGDPHGVDLSFFIADNEDVVALVHNHPNTDITGRTGPSPTDWNAARNYVEGRNDIGSPTRAIASADNFSLFIIDEHGNFAEFDYDDYIDENGLYRRRQESETRGDAGEATDDTFEARDENHQDAASTCE